MALTIGDNFSYMGAKPLDGRLKYDTVASMKAMPDSVLYDGCLAYCVATDKTYQWKSTNDVDATLGKWREFESGSSGGSDNVVEGYYKEADGKFYEEDTYETEIVGEDKVLYISLDTNLIYRWDGSEFVIMGSSSEYTAGDGIVIENDEISTDNMPAEDMPEVASPMPSVMSRRFKYSTDEQIIGSWVDGSKLYQKTILFDTEVTVTSDLWYKIITDNYPSNIKVCVNFVFYRAMNTTDTANATGDIQEWSTMINGDYGFYVYSVIGTNKISGVTIQYTKTTD